MPTPGTDRCITVKIGPVRSKVQCAVFRIDPSVCLIRLYGEGEETIVEVIASIKKEKSLKDVRGISYLDEENKVAITSKRDIIEDLDRIQFPDFEGLEYGGFLENCRCNYDLSGIKFDYPRIYPILTSRGCPFQCTFCYHSLGLKYRKRSIKNVMDELGPNIKKYRI